MCRGSLRRCNSDPDPGRLAISSIHKIDRKLLQITACSDNWHDICILTTCSALTRDSVFFGSALVRVDRSVIALAVLSAVLVFASQARASVVMSVTYYTIAETDPDMKVLAQGSFNNEVQNGLGVDGLPILNTATYGCTSDCFTNTPLPKDLTASGEITWWSPALNSNVTETGTGTVTLPYANDTMFPPNGTGSNDSNGFQAAVYSTILDVPTSEAISFSIGADDVAFVYLNGSIVCDLGGIHADTTGTCTSGILNAGENDLEVFYADINVTQAALTFNVTTSGVTGAPAVPEPSSISLFGVAFAGLGLFYLRRKYS